MLSKYVNLSDSAIIGERKMNVFFKGTIEAGFDVMKAQVEADMAGEAGEFCTE